MLKCWEADAESRLSFREIVAEMSQIMNCSDNYYILDNMDAIDDGYIIKDLTTSPDVNPSTKPDYVNV